jgi:uncharacterized membrane protein YqiK
MNQSRIEEDILLHKECIMNASNKPTSIYTAITTMVKDDDKHEAKWQALGAKVRAHFVAEARFDENLETVKAAIANGLKPAVRDLILLDKAAAKNLDQDEKNARKSAQTQLSNKLGMVRFYAWTEPKAPKAKAEPDPVAIEAARTAIQKIEAAKAETAAKAALGRIALEAKLAKLNFEAAAEDGKRAAQAALKKAEEAKAKAEADAAKAKAEAEAKAEAAKAAQETLKAAQETAKADKARADLKAKLEAALKLAQESTVENVATICNTLRDLIAKI